MKILFLTGNGAFVGSYGGAEKVACNMANDLVRRGFEIVIVCNDIESGLPVWPLNEKIRIVNLNGTGKKLYRIQFFHRLLRELIHPMENSRLSWRFRHAETERRGKFFAPDMKAVLDREKPDLILSFFYEDLFLIPFSESGPAIPVIQMFHGAPSHTLRFSTPRLNRMLGQCLTVQVLLSSFTADIKRFGLQNVSVIPNWGNDYEQGVEYREGEQGHLLYLGRISKEKRPHLLIQAFAQLAKKYPQWTLDLYGTGSGRYYKDVLQMIHSIGGNQIIFHGPTDQVEEVMRASDIFVIPSLFEGFGLALADAMAIGLPSVGFRKTPAINELIREGENGLLADEGADSLAKKLEILMTQPELRARLGKRARELSVAFCQKTVMDTWEKLLNKFC